MFKTRTAFFLDDQPFDTINDFLYITPQPFGFIKFDGINYRIIHYLDVFSKEHNSRVITREVFLKQDVIKKLP
jgi:hypothetical protein